MAPRLFLFSATTWTHPTVGACRFSGRCNSLRGTLHSRSVI